ncbi:MAG: Rieske 2Fe-2S domain-containing protein [Limisphaerales bacterium]
MSLAYRAVDWNRQKRLYDATLAVLLVLTLGAFAGVTAGRNPDFTAETLLLRGSALAALLLLHVILAIGPLARLDPRFLPLLYNRRHLGVTMFLLALLHSVLAVVQFHALGDEFPLVSVFTAYAGGGGGLAHLPFEPFGAAALGILFLLAATSHDFWLRNLGAPVWKALHLGVYAAYGLIVAHVALGVLQSERHPLPALLLGAGFVALAGLHLAAAAREGRLDRAHDAAVADGFVDACALDDLREGRARVVTVAGRRLAVWRHDGRVFATGNVCRHQGGPLGEGRIVDGCITCPWHGWNYRPGDGCSPPPFQEVIPTHDVRVAAGRVWVRAVENPLRTRRAGAAACAQES